MSGTVECHGSHRVVAVGASLEAIEHCPSPRRADFVNLAVRARRPAWAKGSRRDGPVKVTSRIKRHTAYRVSVSLWALREGVHHAEAAFSIELVHCPAALRAAAG